MSRYVHVAMGAVALDEIAAALGELDLAHLRGEQMLQGSLECTGEPVALRVAPGPFGTIEDFGFVIDDGTVRLVCGELDRARLEADLVPRLHAAIARARVVAAGQDAGLNVRTDADVIVVTRRR